MAAKIHGVLGSVSVQGGANTIASAYTVPAGRKATATINLANEHTAANLVQVSIGGAVIESRASIPAGGVLERSGITMQAGRNVAVIGLTGGGGNLIATVWGIEEDV